MARNLQLINGIARGVTLTITYYDHTSSIGVGGVTTGTSITVPSSGSYQSTSDLEVYLNDQPMEPITDWNTAGGGPPYTAIQMTFNLVQNDRLRFRRLS